jgi:hypothetical protein
MKPVLIRDVVTVREHPTVVRLDALFSPESEWIEESYCITEDVRAHIAGLKAAFAEPKGKGIFLIGQYGSGKSHLLAWVITKLSKQEFIPDGPTPVFVSLVNYNSSNRLEEIVCSALGLPCSGGDRRIAFSKIADQHPRGLVLVLDELSEFLRSKPDNRTFNEDVRFLQFLGEWASSQRFWVLSALQESIERTGDIEYELYRKIKDRFPLRLILTPTHIRHLIADGVLLKAEGFEAATAEVIRRLRHAVPPGIEVDHELLASIYPLHPDTLTLLEEIRDRFSQARGAIDFAVTRLRGDKERHVEPFLDRPIGDLLTPDVIIEHYQDLLAVQPEFLPLSDKVLPYFEQNLNRLVPKESLRLLTRRLIHLLCLVHLSRSRKGMTPTEAVYWLAFSAIQIAPEKNLQIIESALNRLATEGRFIKVSQGRYFIDTEEDSAFLFEKLLGRERAQLGESDEALMEELLRLLPDNGINPGALPLEQWQPRDIKWHHHDRRCYVFVGNGAPPPLPGAGVSLVIRLPFGAPEAAALHHTLIPSTLPVDDATRDAVAIGRLLTKPIDEDVSKRARIALNAKLQETARQVSTAYRRAQRLGPSGRSKSAAGPDSLDTTEAWLSDNLRWVLGRTYPSHEQIAPTTGPLPQSAIRTFARFLSEYDIESPSKDMEVDLIRESYLLPMGLLKGAAGGYRLPQNLDRNDLIKLSDPLIQNSPAPKTLYEYLAGPVYGLVPDQIHLLLIFLYYQGEIDIIKDRHSFGELFETFPTPQKYDRIEKSGGLDARRAAELDKLCQAVGVKPPSRHTVLYARQAATRAASECKARVEPLSLLAVNLTVQDNTEDLVKRLRRLIDWTRAFEGADDPLDGLTQLLFEAESASRYIEELDTLRRLPDRIQRIIHERDRFVHLLSGAAEATFDSENAAVLFENLGLPPGLDDIESLERWIGAASRAYDAYTKDYIKGHERMMSRTAKHPARQWQKPPIAALRQAGLRELLDACNKLEQEVMHRECRRMSNLAFQPTCVCGFDGARAPVEALLAELKTRQDEIDQTLERFFAKAEVREQLARFADDRKESDPQLIAYLDNKAPLPKIANIPALEKHLAGLKTVISHPMSKLEETLEGRSWSKEALFDAMARLFDGDTDVPICFEALPPSGPSFDITLWCVEQCLKTGTPLPLGLDDKAVTQAALGIPPAKIAPQALAVIDTLRLPREALHSLLRALLFDTSDPILPKPRSQLVEAVLDAVEAREPKDMLHFAEMLSRAYSAAEEMLKAAAPEWQGHLGELSDQPLLETLPDAVTKLNSDDPSNWIIVDALGVALVPAFTHLLDSLLPDFRLTTCDFARWNNASTTLGCFSALAQAGIQHEFHKIDCIDNLLHERRAPFDDFVKLASAELAVAFKSTRNKLDKRRPILLFADHGFRMTDDGLGLTHGGQTLIESAVPFFYLVPR